MAVTLHDVALRAGVSIKTVSNVVNGYAHVSAVTRSRVEQAVAELGYRPNLSARNMRGGGPESSPWPCRSLACHTSRSWHRA